jgi:hypothetical protein
VNDFDFQNKDLNNFFSLISEAKKEKKEKIDSIVSNSFDDYFWKPLTKGPTSKNKKKKKSTSSVEKIEDTCADTQVDGPVISPVTEDIVYKNKTLIERSLGLLSEPSDTKHNSDPLTPLDQKFATLEDLNKHYSLFLSRIQQQLSTLGGGGETNLTYMDVPITSVTTSSYTIRPQDYYIGVNYAGAVTITLPRADREGKVFVVKDELGEASKGTNRYITILPTGMDLIDGRDRAILAFDYGSLTFVWKGNSWRVI